MSDQYVGKQLGNYQIIRLLGVGGFAQVYLGEHVYLKTTAAIKVLLTHFSQNETHAFLEEARMIARLRHPNIVRVLEFGLYQETVPFLVMAYAPYGTLRDRHPKGTIVPPEAIVSYVKYVASALQYAHEQKIVHRDVKPENMLLGRNQEVLLSDFGIAVTAHTTTSQLKEDVIGTAAYMSPEQIRGKPRSATDQYALGIITYEWCCGERPFDGSSLIQAATHHLYSLPQPLREKLPSLPREVELVVMRTLAKDPNERYPSVEAFAQALEDASLPYISPRSASSSSNVVAISPLPHRPNTSYTTQRVTLTANRLPPLETSPEIESKVKSSGRRTLIATGVVGVAGLSGLAALGIWFTNTRGSPVSVGPTPTTKLVATSAVLPSRAVGTVLATYSEHTKSVNGVGWSPDGAWIASGSDDKTVRIWSPTTGKTAYSYTQHSDGIDCVQWAPKGNYLASSGKDKTVHVWNTSFSSTQTPGKTVFVYQQAASRVPSLSWSPDATRIASTTISGPGQPMVQVWDALSGKHSAFYQDLAQAPPPPVDGPVNAVAWSPNGRYLVSSVMFLVVWNAEDGTRLAQYDGHAADYVHSTAHGLVWSPDSKRVASAGEDKTVQIWDALNQHTYFVYRGHSDAVYAVAWSPDGQYLASASRDKTVQIWNATTDKPLFTFHGHSAPVRAVNWSRDSKHIVSAGEDAKALVWQAV